MKKLSSMALAFVLAGGSVLGMNALHGQKAYAAVATQQYTADDNFGTSQGAGQWYYQKRSGSVYINLVFDAANGKWHPQDSAYPWISKDAQHPDTNFDAVRTWVAPGAGTITISGTVATEAGQGDGIFAAIKKGDTMLWKSAVNSKTGALSASVQNVAVAKGTAIYFIVNRAASMNNDHTMWDPSISFKADPAAAQAAQVGTVAKAASAVKTAAAVSPSIPVTSCGAVANDGADDYAAFVACLDKAKQEGKYVTVPAGNYTLSKILTIDGVKLIGAGRATTTLTSTDPERGSIDLKGNGPKLSGIKHVYATTVARGDGANEKNSITVKGATNFVVDSVYVYKSSTAGILVEGGARAGRITNNIVDSTGADGIHMTDGSSDILVQGNLVKATGDDTIAVVSYAQDGSVVHDITIKNNDVGYLSKARGITVVGGTDVLIQGNSVKDTQMAGIYIASEANYNTLDVNRITVYKNTVDHAGLHEPENHPNILVYASHGVIDNIKFSNNIIKNAAHRGIGVWGDGNIKNIYFTANTLINKTGEKTTFKTGVIHLLNNTGF